MTTGRRGFECPPLGSGGCLQRLAVIAFAESFSVFLVGMAVTGMGEGAYLAVDLALVTDVLPNPDEAAKEMAVFNVASALPSAVASAVAPLFLAIPVLSKGTGDNYVAFPCVDVTDSATGCWP